jgi:hypothetical protein
LSRYLEALPLGPHAEQANQRILELERGRRGEVERDARALAKARLVQDRVRRAAEARSEFVFAVAEWVRRLSTVDSWGKRTSDLDHEFIHAYRVSEPVAACDTTLCTKNLRLSYQVSGAGELVSREATIAIELDLEDGGIVRARLAGPALFSRVGEATQNTAVEPFDLQARAEAIGQSARVVAHALEATLPEASCRREAVSPVVLERACNGLRARMVAAEVEGDDDVVSFEPSGEQGDGAPQHTGPER